MRVLKAPEPWMGEAHCRDCGADLEVEFSDLILYTGHDLSGVDESSIYVVCPICGNQIEPEMPRYVQRLLVEQEKKKGK